MKSQQRGLNMKCDKMNYVVMRKIATINQINNGSMVFSGMTKSKSVETTRLYYAFPTFDNHRRYFMTALKVYLKFAFYQMH
jgi:hypothetical protein